jgi:echinoid
MRNFIAESPYHDVSGLPDPYIEQMQMGEDQIDHSKAPQQHHMSMGYDETPLESGYSTPNSRNRRVIREIIV